MRTFEAAVGGSGTPGLPIASWAGLIAAIEEALTVERADQLREWLQGRLAGVLPHRHFHCSLGAITGARLRESFVAADGGLETYIARYRPAAGELATPAFRRWSAGNQPVTDADLDAQDLTRLRADGIDRLIVFGHADRAGGWSSYCELGGLLGAAPREAAYVAQLLTPYLHAALVRAGASRAVANVQGGTPGSLTPREKEVLRWISEGKSVWETAQILGRSEHTIKNQVRRVYTKLGIHSRVQAARIADRLLGQR